MKDLKKEEKKKKQKWGNVRLGSRKIEERFKKVGLEGSLSVGGRLEEKVEGWRSSRKVGGEGGRLEEK